MLVVYVVGVFVVGVVGWIGFGLCIVFWFVFF